MGKYSCEACKKKCKKEAIRLQDKYFHVGCFMCKECKKPLATDNFYTKDNAHYCNADYQRLFGTKCFSCGKAAEGEVMTVLGKTYHQECFRCSKCLKKFQPGEKATFVNDEHWCRACQQQQQQQQKKDEAPASAVVDAFMSQSTEPDASKTAGSASIVETATSPQPVVNENDRETSEKVNSPVSKQEIFVTNGFQSPVEPDNDVKTPADVTAVKSQKPATNLPRVFGMPDSKFYNHSYLERPRTEFKRGSSLNAKEPAILHYHRPDNFSYSNLRKDFKSETGGQAFGDKKHMLLLSKRPDAQMKPLAPIERDDWPGPPEPAAAYPELLRDRAAVAKPSSADETNEEEKRVSKEINELSKMTDSGAATVILRDLKKKRSESPTLDPRNSSMTPSAALEPHHRLRYEQPFFASPSRNLDMLERIQQDEKSRKSLHEPLLSSNVSNIARPGYGLSLLRPGSSFDGRNGYQSDGGEIDHRPKSSAAFLQSYTIDVYDDQRHNSNYDPTTGLRRSTHLKSSTLPQGLSGRYFYDSIHLSSPVSKEVEGPKIYPYEVLCQKNYENLIGVDRESLERHLSKDEFELVFQMKPEDFYRLPVWQRNEAKLRAGLA